MTIVTVAEVVTRGDSLNCSDSQRRGTTWLIGYRNYNFLKTPYLVEY